MTTNNKTKRTFRILSLIGLLALGFGIGFGIEITEAVAAENAKIEPFDLTTESMTNPLGIDAAAPRLSWKSRAINSEDRDLVQTAYQILVASSPKNLANDDGDLWDSGKVASNLSIFIDYQGKPLESSQRCYWKVRVWDGDDLPSSWSDSASWIMGVLRPEDWKAKWIAQPEKLRPEINLAQGGARWIVAPDDSEAARNVKPAPQATNVVSDEDYILDAAGETKVRYFRREFDFPLNEDNFKNQKFIGFFHYAANKRFEIFVNGRKVGHSIGMIFNPDQLRSLDVTEYLLPGKKNVLAVQVSNDDDRPTALLGQLELRLLANQNDSLGRPAALGRPDQTFEYIATDENWSVSTSAVENWNQPDFDAQWANAVSAFDPDDGPWGKVRRRTELVSPMFQKTFAVDRSKKIETATLHITGLGFYEAFLDGEKIGTKKLDPAPTRFDKTVLYSTYDLTDSLKNAEKDDRVLEIMLGHGWFDVRSIVTWNFDAAPWRDFPRTIAQLEIVYEDGTQETIVTDDSWDVLSSPILFDCIRQGEIVQGDYRPTKLNAAVCVDAPKGKLKAESFPGTTIVRKFFAKSVRETSPGVWLVDLGQNIAGWARVNIRDARTGDVVRFRYSERILDDGSIERFDIAQHFMEGSPFYYAGEKGQFQTDFYLASDEKIQSFEPRFTYNGFQYIEVTGLRSPPKPDDFVACVVHNDFQQVGSFECDLELLNKIQNATLWSYRANFVDGYPTDCPHREKNGWTGDAHLAAEQAMFNWENSAAYEKWIDDLIDEQRTNGNLAAIVPTGGWGYPWGNGPAWDSSLVLIPWYLYQYRGDVRILEKSFDAIKKYLDFMATKATDDLVSHGLGDWVFYKTETPTVVTSSAFYYIDALIVAKIATILGKTDDAKKYYDLADRIQKAYNAELYQGDGVYSIAGQTAQTTPLHQGLADSLTPEDRERVFAKLVEAVEKTDYHFDVGIFGAKYILRTLSENGRNDLALRLMLQESRPSYADWIRRGAGTLWEDWGNGSSRNHIMFGDVSAWFYQSLAGIKLLQTPEQATQNPEDESGDPEFRNDCSENYRPFGRFWIAPNCRLSDISVPEGSLTWVDASIDSPLGTIVSNWRWNDEKTELTLKCSVPVNAKACVALPCDEKQTVLTTTPERFFDLRPGVRAVWVGSGDYEFKVVPKN